MAVQYPNDFLNRLRPDVTLRLRPNFQDRVKNLVSQCKLKETIMSIQENQTPTRVPDLLKTTTVKALKDAVAFTEAADLNKITNLVALEQLLISLTESVSKTTYIAKQAIEDRERLIKLEQSQHPRHTTRNVDALQQAAKDPSAIKHATDTEITK